MTEVRLITFRSATFARSARISSCTPSVKNAFSWFALRFSNGSTAILFSGIAVETPATAPTLGRAGLKTPKYQPPTASASKQSDASTITRTLFFDCGRNDLIVGGPASAEGICNLRAISVTDWGRRPGSFAKQAATHSSHTAGIGSASISNSFRRSVIDGG